MVSTKEIQLAIGKTQVLKAYHVCENIHLLHHEADVVSVSKSGVMREFEVKVSRRDYLRDSTKCKRQFLDVAHRQKSPNYFSYVCPAGLIKPSELPAYAGLYYVTDDLRVHEVKAPAKLHGYKHDMYGLLLKMCRVHSERQFLGVCMLTHQNKQIKNRKARTNENKIQGN